MRYSFWLRHSSQPNVLKHHFRSSIVSLLGFVAAFGAITYVVNFTHLDTHQLVIGFLASLARVSAAYVMAVGVAVVPATTICRRNLRRQQTNQPPRVTGVPVGRNRQKEGLL